MEKGAASVHYTTKALLFWEKFYLLFLYRLTKRSLFLQRNQQDIPLAGWGGDESFILTLSRGLNKDGREKYGAF